VISISGLSFQYAEGDFRLRIPELTVEKGITAAFIGPSGSGKTTLLNLIAGIAVPQSGTVTTHGVEVSALSDAERRDFRITTIGLAFQEFELLEYLSVLDNVLLPYRINHALELTAAVRDRARELAQRMAIEEHLSRHPSHLSQGERQRVAVCRSVLTDPPILLADEPTGNLDPVNKERVLGMLFDYVEESGTTLVTVTHDHDALARFQQVIDFKTFHDVANAGREAGAEVETA
jgi:ABC-type lipoprotein export system ATPase subunit